MSKAWLMAMFMAWSPREPVRHDDTVEGLYLMERWLRRHGWLSLLKGHSFSRWFQKWLHRMVLRPRQLQVYIHRYSSARYIAIIRWKPITRRCVTVVAAENSIARRPASAWAVCSRKNQRKWRMDAERETPAKGVRSASFHIDRHHQRWYIWNW